MAIFKNAVPVAPGPKSRPNAVRESDTIKALDESRNVLQRLINLLAPYQPTQINAIGKRVEVLAIDLGQGPTIAAGAAAPSHPFKVIKQNIGTDTAPHWQAMVILNSSLMKSLKPTDNQAITGLDVFFDLSATDTIWLGVVFTPGTSTITSCSIDSLGQGDSFNPTVAAWSGSNGYCEDDGGTPPKHQTSRTLIAFAKPDIDGTTPIITQCCFTNLILRPVCIDLRPAIFPFPSPYGPYVP